ncbi:LpqB family beta-propeller domain-containing protein [Myxococcaceae bacterium GXIMD 01537]
MRGTGRKHASWPVRARLSVALALLGAGCAGTCGRAPGPGPLTERERRALPGTIAFISERAGQKDVWLVKPTGEETQLTRAPEDEFVQAPSPDGKALLVVASRIEGEVRREQLRVVPLDGGEAVALHAPRGRARNASWGPDGRWLVAESDAQGFSDLVRMEPRADAPEVALTRVREGCFEPAVSPDGSRLAFVSSQEGDPEIYVMGLGGGEAARRLTTFHRDDWGPRWSPDGQWLAFFSSRENGRERLYVMRADGTDLRAVSGAAPTGDEREAVWSPDGQRLVFVGKPREGRSRVWVARLAGGEPVALTDSAGADDQPDWSPDGQHLVYVSERDGEADLYLMRADGSGKTRLTTARGADWLPRWFAAR